MRQAICHTRCHHGRVVNGKYVAKVFEVGETALFREGEAVPPHFELANTGRPAAGPEPGKPLASCTLQELRAYARDLDLKGWSGLSKPQLAEFLAQALDETLAQAPSDHSAEGEQD